MVWPLGTGWNSEEEGGITSHLPFIHSFILLEVHFGSFLTNACSFYNKKYWASGSEKFSAFWLNTVTSITKNIYATKVLINYAYKTIYQNCLFNKKIVEQTLWMWPQATRGTNVLCTIYLNVSNFNTYVEDKLHKDRPFVKMLQNKLIYKTT